MIEQQEKGVENINLVTPTSYALHIIEAIKRARNKGLKIPIVYNTNGYENVETLRSERQMSVDELFREVFRC